MSCRALTTFKKLSNLHAPALANENDYLTDNMRKYVSPPTDNDHTVVRKTDSCRHFET
jgi:hypothetical protein